MPLLVLALMLFALVVSGAAFGFFYAWSFTVMRGFGAAGGPVAIAAMQSVNAGIMTPWFALVFFGAPVATAVAGLAAWLAGAPGAAAWLAVATGLYLVGCFAVTILANVPMNDALARIDAATVADADAAWHGYARPWTAWNHVRTAACGGTLLCAALALLRWPG